MSIIAKKTITKTKKQYSVVLGIYDPPEPVFVLNTDSLTAARFSFESLKRIEIEETRKFGNVGGEWDLVLYKHTPETTILTHATDNDFPGSEGVDVEGKFVYNIIYKDSIELDSFGYMDCMAFTEEVT